MRASASPSVGLLTRKGRQSRSMGEAVRATNFSAFMVSRKRSRRRSCRVLRSPLAPFSSRSCFLPKTVTRATTKAPSAPGREGCRRLRSAGVGRKRVAEIVDIFGVNHGGAGIEAGGKGRSGSGPPVREFVDAVVVQVVQKSQTVETHGVGLLRDRRRN